MSADARPRKRRRLEPAAALVLAVLAGACDKGAPQYGGDVAPDDPVALYGQCAFCHAEATTLALTGGHGSVSIPCQACHDDIDAANPGPGHATVPQCSDCHPEQETHMDPAAGTPSECLVCHTPHGSPNLLLVDTFITTAQGPRVPILFDNLGGRADGSFASVSDPGSGICEACHTTTLYYRSDGTGAPHFAFPCQTCHPHTQGFAPE